MKIVFIASSFIAGVFVTSVFIVSAAIGLVKLLIEKEGILDAILGFTSLFSSGSFTTLAIGSSTFVVSCFDKDFISGVAIIVTGMEVFTAATGFC